MRFEDFIPKGQVRRTSKDENLARALVKQTEKDMLFFGKLTLDEHSARKMVSNYYDFLRSMVEAMAALDGYKIYSHEVFTFYLKEKKEMKTAEQFDRFRRIRNKINYYGEMVAAEEAKEIIDDIKEIVASLREKYLRGLG